MVMRIECRLTVQPVFTMTNRTGNKNMPITCLNIFGLLRGIMFKILFTRSPSCTEIQKKMLVSSKKYIIFYTTKS